MSERYVMLLQGINVGSRNRVPTPELRSRPTDAGDAFGVNVPCAV